LSSYYILYELKKIIGWFWPYFLDILCFNILNNLLHFWFVALKYKLPYIFPLYLCNVYNTYLNFTLSTKWSYLTPIRCTKQVSQSYQKKWTTLNLSNSWHMYQKVSRENWLLYISPVNGISIRFASMEINYLTSLHCIISIYIYIVSEGCQWQ
jgi:hypothetical protein